MCRQSGNRFPLAIHYQHIAINTMFDDKSDYAKPAITQNLHLLKKAAIAANQSLTRHLAHRVVVLLRITPGKLYPSPRFGVGRHGAEYARGKYRQPLHHHPRSGLWLSTSRHTMVACLLQPGYDHTFRIPHP